MPSNFGIGFFPFFYFYLFTFFKERDIRAILNMALSGCEEDVNAKAMIGFRGHWPGAKS